MYYVEYLNIYVICEDCDAIRICQVIYSSYFKKYIFANLNIGGTKTPYSPQWWFLQKQQKKSASRPLSVSVACLAIYCDRQESVFSWIGVVFC